MENNYIDNENINIVSEEKKQTVNKKAMLFISLSIIIPAVIEKLGTTLLVSFIPDITFQETFASASSILSVATSVLGLVLILIFTSKLTKDKTEAIHFLSIYAMGKALGTIAESILSFILEIFFPTTKISASVVSWIQLATLITGTIASIIFACILYSKLIENNTINSVSFVEYSKIKKNMIFSYICLILVSAALTAVMAIIPVLESTGIAPEGFTKSNFILVLSDFINTITLIATFGILYFFGFRQNKNREDGLNFASCYYFPAVFNIVVSSILGAVFNLLKTNTDSIAISSSLMIISLLTSVVSIAMMIIEIVLVFYALKHIFPVQQIEFEYSKEETYSDDFYVEPAHIENTEIQEINIEKICNDDSAEESEKDTIQ